MIPLLLAPAGLTSGVVESSMQPMEITSSIQPMEITSSVQPTEHATCTGIHVDVGGNNGQSISDWFHVQTCADKKWPCMWQMPAWLSKSVRSGYCVEVFEPNPVHWPKLDQVAALWRRSNHSVTVHRKAFGTVAGNVTHVGACQTCPCDTFRRI